MTMRLDGSFRSPDGRGGSKSSAVNGRSIPLTARERYFIRLALGFGPVNRATVATRNIYQATKGTENYEVWTSLAARGLAFFEDANNNSDLMDFYVSGRAARAVLREGETIDKGTMALLDAIDAKIDSKSQRPS